MTLAVLRLAEHQDFQDLAREEVNRILNENNGNLGEAEISQLRYLDRFAKECLRLHPPTLYLSRELGEDCVLCD